MHGRRKILVVDDEVVVRDLLTTVLERAGYEVILAEDGLSGVERAASDKPDLVVADGLLPRLHGFLACRAGRSSAITKRMTYFSNPLRLLIS